LARKKWMYADLALEHHALKDALAASWQTTATFRTEVLDRYVFTTLAEVRRMTEDRRHRYNHDRPHRSLGRLSPIRRALTADPSPKRLDQPDVRRKPAP
jgi:transposase InsO family protein